MKLIRVKNRVLAQSRRGHTFDVTSTVTWWTCPMCGHEWKGNIGNTYKRTLKCPKCKEFIICKWCLANEDKE